MVRGRHAGGVDPALVGRVRCADPGTVGNPFGFKVGLEGLLSFVFETGHEVVDSGDADDGVDATGELSVFDSGLEMWAIVGQSDERDDGGASRTSHGADFVCGEAVVGGNLADEAHGCFYVGDGVAVSVVGLSAVANQGSGNTVVGKVFGERAKFFTILSAEAAALNDDDARGGGGDLAGEVEIQFSVVARGRID